jgi:hypothetical protein
MQSDNDAITEDVNLWLWPLHRQPIGGRRLIKRSAEISVLLCGGRISCMDILVPDSGLELHHFIHVRGDHGGVA